MIKANDINGNAIYAKNANKTNKYFCIYCKEKLIFKQGKIKKAHFAHKGYRCCSSILRKTHTDETNNSYGTINDLWNDTYKWMLIENVSGEKYVIFDKLDKKKAYGYPPKTTYKKYKTNHDLNRILIKDYDLPIWKLLCNASNDTFSDNRNYKNPLKGYTVYDLAQNHLSSELLILKHLPFNMYFAVQIDRNVKDSGDIIIIPYQYVPNSGELISLKKPSTYHQDINKPVWIKITTEEVYKKANEDQ